MKTSIVYYTQIIVSLIGVFAFWQLAVLIFEIPSYVLPMPTKILTTLFIQKQYLIKHSMVTLVEILLGFGIGSAFGFVLALAISSFRFLEKVLYPLLIFTQVTPKIAVAPLFIIWFGYGLLPKVIITALMSFFPVVVNMVKGLKQVHPDLVSLMSSLSATKKQILYKIRLPSAMPFLFSALKVSITLSVIGAVIGEFVGADKGLGYVIMVANANLETSLVFAALTILCFIGTTLFLIIGVIEKTLFKKYYYQIS